MKAAWLNSRVKALRLGKRIEISGLGSMDLIIPGIDRETVIGAMAASVVEFTPGRVSAGPCSKTRWRHFSSFAEGCGLPAGVGATAARPTRQRMAGAHVNGDFVDAIDESWGNTTRSGRNNVEFGATSSPPSRQSGIEPGAGFANTARMTTTSARA
jgi:hypothetical protein